MSLTKFDKHAADVKTTQIERHKAVSPDLDQMFPFRNDLMLPTNL